MTSRPERPPPSVSGPSVPDALPDGEPAGGGGAYGVHVEGELPLRRIFTSREADLVQRILAASREAESAQQLAEALRGGLRSLGTIALALESYPSLKDRQTLAARERSFETLLSTLIEGGEHGMEWALPTKAVLSRTYGIAKVNFFTSLAYALEPLGGGAGPEASRMPPLLADLRAAIDEAVFTRLAEELYAAFVTSRFTSRPVKVLAAQHLVDLWDGRIRLATDRFCPMLRSAWAARTSAPRVFGTMLGTQEICTLLFQDCDEKFVKWFGQRSFESEERQAFEEFLFDLPFENLELIRTRMREDGKTCVGPREVERYLGFREGQLRPLVGDAKALYVSFRRRRVKAQYRASVGVPGPKRTAEGYLLEALLLEEEAGGGGAR